jgi:hypothetical protein
MTQAFNLSQFANTLNTSGQTSNGGLQNSSVTVTAGTGMSGGGAVALGSSVTLNNAGVTSVTAGTGISVSASTGGVTISNSATSYSGIGSKIFTTSGTFTIPSNITQLLVTVIGGGGAGYNGNTNQTGGGGGGGGGTIQGYISGLTAGSNVYVTVGGSGGSSSFGYYLTATAGSTGYFIYGGAGGSSSASGATIVYQATGSTGNNGDYYYCDFTAYPLGGGGGNSGIYLNMPSFNFNPRGGGGTGSGISQPSGDFIPATGGSAGLVIINW